MAKQTIPPGLTRTERQAAALRQNLKRRKAGQERPAAPPPEPPQGAGPGPSQD